MWKSFENMFYYVKMFNIRLLYILIPLILSNIQQLAFPSDFQKNKKVFFQPPGYVFGIVWTILYLLLGIYLYRILNSSNKLLLLIFAINLIFNMCWTPVVNNMRMYNTGIYILGLLILTTLMLIVLENDTTNKALLVPYITWLLFALLLNIELSRLYKSNQVRYD